MRAELQAASDAAAMAGEEVLLSQATANNAAAQAAAQLIWNANYCDGKLLSASNAVMFTTIGQTGGMPSLPTLKVTADVRTVNLFGMLLGHGTDTLNITSTAGPGAVGTAFGAFPMTVVNRNYQPGTTYTWYMSDAPGLVPGLTNALSMGLTGFSAGSTPPLYPNNMLGDNTARFLTTYNANLNGGLLGATQALANGVGGPLGLGSPGTVIGGVVDATVGTTGTTLESLLTGSNVGPDSSALSMMDYYSQHFSTTPGNGTYQLTANTQPNANAGAWPSLPTTPIAPPSLGVGQEVYLTTGSNSSDNNTLNTTAQFMQGSTGNLASGSRLPTYTPSQLITGSTFPGTNGTALQGTVASWLQGQTIVIPLTNPVPTTASINVPILNINLLGVQDSTTSTYSSSANGILGGIVEPLTGISDATPISAVVDRFIAVKIQSVTVEYQGSNGLGLLGLNLLNSPWAQQVVRITGTVQPYAGVAGYGTSSHASGNATGAYAAMLIQ